MTRLLFKLFFAAFTLSTAQISFNITGSDEIDNDIYLEWLTPYANDSLILPGSELSAIIIEKLNSEGYYNAEVSAEFVNDSSVNISVFEGGQFLIGNIKSNADKNLRLLFSNYEGRVFSTANIEDLTDRILGYYEKNGFPFAKIEIASVEMLSGSVNIYLQITEGKPVKIDRIEIIGNDKTNPEVIKRSIGVKEGDIFIENELSEIKPRLNRLNYFSKVSEPEFCLNDADEGILRLTIEEKQTNNFDGILGYVPGNEDSEGYVTGFININLRNLFGTGRAAAIKWHRENQSSQELNLKYLEPWIFGFPVNIQGALFQRKQDSAYIKRSFSGEIEYKANKLLSASMLIASEATIPGDAASGQNIANTTALTTGIKFTYDSRDNIFAPRRGILFTNTYYYNNKSLNSGTSANISDLQKFEAGLDTYWELFFGNIFSQSFNVREIRGDYIEISDMYLLGGTTTLRGYRENQFNGSRLFWSNTEYRYLLSETTYAFAFIDFGYYLREPNEQLSITGLEGTKTGYGAGLNLETGLGILSVSYALGEGDTFSTGKIHFGLVNEF